VVVETDERRDLSHLVEIMRTLRAENGCPWDRKQTHRSLRTYLIEEAYEVIQAIDDEDDDELCEELGDVLLQVVFHSQIAHERGKFSIADVIEGIVEKMIRRHPHVFSDVEANDSETVLRNWERIKQKEHAEGGDEEGQVSILHNVAGAMPALMRAVKVQAKASRVGFDWPDVEGALSKVSEELSELEEARLANDVDTADEAIRELHSLATGLETQYPDAAASLREGLEETVTVLRLRIPGLLQKSLRSTNTIESTFSMVAKSMRNVKNWKNGTMVRRWVCVALLDAENRTNRIAGYRSMGVLISEIQRLTNVDDEDQAGSESKIA
jgi:MazG family protein